MGDRYDHRLRNAIVESGDKDLFRDLNTPNSTIRDWLRKGKVKVITNEALSLTNEEPIFENQMLRQEIKHEKARINLVTNSVNVMGFQVQYLRLPTSEAKSRLIEITQSASKVIPIKECLDAIKLSAARYRSWVIRQRKCPYRLKTRSS